MSNSINKSKYLDIAFGDDKHFLDNKTHVLKLTALKQETLRVLDAFVTV